MEKRTIRLAVLAIAIALPSCAPSAPSSGGGGARVEEIRTELLKHPRLTEVEKDALRSTRNLELSTPDSVSGRGVYLVGWIAGDHRVEVEGNGSFEDLPHALVRRFALKSQNR
jgi:hypothetical protein